MLLYLGRRKDRRLVLIVSGIPVVLAHHVLWECARQFGIFDAGLTANEVRMIKRIKIDKLTL